MKVEPQKKVSDFALDEDNWVIGNDDSDIVAMPLLAHAAAEHHGALTGLKILYINHAISDALMVARALRGAGAELVNVLVPYRGIEDRSHHSLSQAFSALGPTYAPAPQHPSLFSAVMAETVAAAIVHIADSASANGQQWMIVEDGGYAFPALHDNPDLTIHMNSCLGAVEHTTRGRWNYEYLETDAAPKTPRTLRRPAVTISGSRLKTTHEAGYVAQALVDECHWLLRRDHQFLRHRKVMIIGYGRVGRALAQALQRADASITIHDNALVDTDADLMCSDPISAVEDGAFLVFGATGTSSFGYSALEAFIMRSPSPILYLASASSKAIEFADVVSILDQAAVDNNAAIALAGPGSTVLSHLDPEVGLRYTITVSTPSGSRTRTLVLLGKGYPVIFYPAHTHGAPNRAMDPVMTQLFLAAVGLPAACLRLTAAVHDINDLIAMPNLGLPASWKTLVDEESLLIRWCEENNIDWSEYRREIGFDSNCN